MYEWVGVSGWIVEPHLVQDVCFHSRVIQIHRGILYPQLYHLPRYWCVDTERGEKHNRSLLWYQFCDTYFQR